jgi:hypothetical protein
MIKEIQSKRERMQVSRGGGGPGTMYIPGSFNLHIHFTKKGVEEMDLLLVSREGGV